MVVFQNNNFDGWLLLLIAETLGFIIIAVSLFCEFRYDRNNQLYSFETILDLGLFMFFSLLAVLFTALSVYVTIRFRDYTSNTVFQLMSNAMDCIVILTVPALVIFAVFMVTTNLSLIRHEGFRVVNLLGIILSSLFLAGVALSVVTKFLMPYIYLDSKFVNILQLCITSIVSVAEWLFAASALCCYFAAVKKPRYDSDYVIVLGCSIRKDGSLTPLLRGRVEGAISYYRKRLELTGQKTYIIPSGGQGSNEKISESEAMSNYLLSQGIPKEQILMENQSKNTYENMLFSKQLIGLTDEKQKIYFSTTSYHIFRSGMLAYKVGMNGACGIGCKTKRYFWPNAFVREFIGMCRNLRRKLVYLLIIVIAISVVSGIFLF